MKLLLAVVLSPMSLQLICLDNCAVFFFMSRLTRGKVARVMVHIFVCIKAFDDKQFYASVCCRADLGAVSPQKSNKFSCNLTELFTHEI